jgi:hypothetical protein
MTDNAIQQDAQKDICEEPTMRRLTMTGLLASIVEAHGRLDRWRRFNRVEATIVTGGAFWGMKNLSQDQDPRRMTVSLHEERASVAPFGDPDWHTEFTPDRIAILRGDGTVVGECHDPHTSFAGDDRAGWPWRLPARAPTDPDVRALTHPVLQPTAWPAKKGPRG